MQGELGEILRNKRHHAGIMRARGDFAENHLVAAYKQLYAEETIAAERQDGPAGDLLRALQRQSAHLLRLPGFTVIAVFLTVANRVAEMDAINGANGEQSDFEITLLTVSAVDGVHFCDPIGHRQEDGDYRESWQPQQMSALALKRAQEIARRAVLALGGYGLFGVELFVCGDEVIFSEVSPRPHDTGMVTLISQDLSEFALHVRAFLGLPVGGIRQYGPAASAVILPELTSRNVTFDNVDGAVGAGLQIRLFGKPEIDGTRRLGVALATGDNVDDAVARAKAAAANVKVEG